MKRQYYALQNSLGETVGNAFWFPLAVFFVQKRYKKEGIFIKKCAKEDATTLFFTKQ